MHTAIRLFAILYRHIAAYYESTDIDIAKLERSEDRNAEDRSNEEIALRGNAIRTNEGYPR
jgi:hypothetical protein|tara:strand:+ start:54 stop:236 length:183 start_codon:yes stop_codon:yes gene_type:complete